MSDFLLFILISLTAFRVWRLLAFDKLPPIMWVRDKVEGWVDAKFGIVWADGVTCPNCTGAWISFATVGAVWHYRPLPLPALWFAAAAAAVGFLAQYDKG